MSTRRQWAANLEQITTLGSNVSLQIWNSTGKNLCFAENRNRVISARCLDSAIPDAFELKDNRLLVRGFPVPMPDPVAGAIVLQVETEPEPVTQQTSGWIPGDHAT